MYYTVHDRKDDYRATFYSKEDAIAAAINHCVVEGLIVRDFCEIEDSITIIYIDPNDNSPQDIAIFKAF